MWKRIFSFGVGLVCVVGVLYAESNAVLLRINGESITADEFERYLKKYAAFHPQVNPQEYLSDFVLFKLKVTDALAHRWDTLPNFKRQYAALWEERTERLSRLSWEKHDWVCLSYLTYPLSQRATDKEEAEARVRMDSVYSFLKQGHDWEEVASRFSGSIEYRKAEWQPEVGLLNELKEQLDGLAKGSFSSPFFSPVGIHIIRYEGKEKRKEESDDLLLAGGEAEELFYKKELHDGLLASYWDQRIKIVPDSVDEKELEQYFRHHRERYEWEFPHFKGAVIHCANKKVASKIRKRLKKLPMEEWKAALDKLEREDTLYQAEMEVGLFQIGTNAFVDKLSFKCGEHPVHPRYAYSFVMGKRLKKYPETYRDVSARVVKDFRKEKEMLFLQSLMQRFPVEIQQDVLKTVNCGRNNEE